MTPVWSILLLVFRPTVILSEKVVHIKNGTILYSFVYQMSNSEKTASSIVSDSPVESTDAKQPELPDSSYQRLWLVMGNCTTISFRVGD